MKKNLLVLCLLVLFLISFPPITFGATTIAVSTLFYYTFNVPGTLYETGSMADSTSGYWWLNSGAGMPAFSDGLGGTLQGSLATSSAWRTLYASSNPTDTDNGYHPQNIFRLLTRSTWQNVREQAYFRINTDNLSKSPNRNESNGLLLFSRYYDNNNVYYAGIRVDGAAVIKKKINGTYYTLAYKKILSGTYNHDSNPDLIPKHTWIGLRTETVNNTDGSVTIKFYTDIGQTGTWTLVLNTTDNGSTYGGKALTNSAYAGIRTDFMDVSFDNYKLEKI